MCNLSDHRKETEIFNIL